MFPTIPISHTSQATCCKWQLSVSLHSFFNFLCGTQYRRSKNSR